MACNRSSTLDDGWALDGPEPLPPAPPASRPPAPRPPSPPIAPRLAIARNSDESPRGKRRRLARGTDPANLLKRHGLRRVVAQPGQFADQRPLPGVTPLATPSAVVAAKILATFPAHSDAAHLARSIIANPPPTATIAETAPRRRDLTPRSRMVTAALHRFGAVCYVSALPTRAQTARLPADRPAASADATPARRPLWKRLFGT